MAISLVSLRDRVKSGNHFITGDHAVAEGAIAAGCNFFAGYPITPATPIAERISWRFPQIGGEYIQMEDEIASAAAIVGASSGGAKAMTATSGPGISLMLENIGLGYMMEVPIVLVNVMRGGPSTGMPTLTSQGDIMQARWGSHGDFNMIAYCPSTVQEMFDFTIKAFNAAETYRTPVMVLADQILGLMTANITIPEPDDIEIRNRVLASGPIEDYNTYNWDELIPPMAIAGQGYAVHMTGLTHDEHGYPDANVDAQAKLMKRLKAKFDTHLDDIVEYDEIMLEDAEIALIAYGSESRSAFAAVKRARAKGIKVGLLRMKTVWPFPEKLIHDLSTRVNSIIVPEVNMGQYVHPVREYADCPVHSLPHYGGEIHHPDVIVQKIEEVMQ